MPNQSIVIHGPKGCGKTLNGQRLARRFGLTRVVDEDGPNWDLPIPANTLLLTSDEPPPGAVGLINVRVMSFAEAMHECGFARSPSTNPR